MGEGGGKSEGWGLVAGPLLAFLNALWHFLKVREKTWRPFLSRRTCLDLRSGVTSGSLPISRSHLAQVREKNPACDLERVHLIKFTLLGVEQCVLEIGL